MTQGFPRGAFVAKSLVLACSLASAVTTFSEDAKVITPEIIVGLRRVRQVALDPSGARLAYVLRVPDGPDRKNKDDEGGSEIWVMPSAGGEARQYSVRPESSSSIAWSPDGKLLTFASRRASFHEKRQIWAMPIDGGAPRLLTRHATGVGSYRWSPDGKSIAFLAIDEESDEDRKAREAGNDQLVRDSNFRYTRLWVQDVATGESRVVYEGDLEASTFIWTPDGAAIVFQASDTPLVDDSYMYRRIYRVEIPGSGTATPRIVCKTRGKLGDMAVSPDGKWLAFAGATSLNDPLAQSVFLVLAGGGGARNLTPQVDWSVGSLDWLDNGTILIAAQRAARTVLFRHSVESGESKTLFASGPIIFGFDLCRKAKRIALTAAAPSHPTEAFVADLEGGGSGAGTLHRRTTSNPELASLRLAKQEIVEWTARDGARINGILTYPLDHEPGKRSPLVLQVHGGPEGVSEHGWNTRSGYPVQLLAAKGFMVLEPNYRGSGGHGVAFSKGDHDDLGGSEFTDVLDGIDALVERGLVDRDRVGCAGWSYGGYFSAWAATRHSERFKAAAMCAGISNWISFSGTTDIPHEMALVHWNSYWYHEPKLHWKRSPLGHIDRARTPTLIVHGARDLRVPVGQGAELYTALKHKGVPTELVIYPREPHGLNERAHQIDFMNRLVRWFEKYVK